MNKHHIVFFLEQDDLGYPPVASERLWVDLVDERRAVIDNIPFFAREATLGDTVEYKKSGSELHYVRTLERSGNSLLRVICHAPADPAETRRKIESYGCETEYDLNHNLIAVSVPPDGDLQGLQAFLQDQEDRRVLGYEEAILMK